MYGSLLFHYSLQAYLACMMHLIALRKQLSFSRIKGLRLRKKKLNCMAFLCRASHKTWSTTTIFLFFFKFSHIFLFQNLNIFKKIYP